MNLIKAIIAFFLLFAGESFFGAQAAQREDAMSMTLTSPAFAMRGEIPILYTGQGKDISPPLSISSVPISAKSLALIVDDPDAPDPAAPKMTWVHWVLYNLPTNTTTLFEGIAALPKGTREGLNDFNRKNYGGPMPPVGRHRYFFKLYALDTTLEFEGTPRKADVEKAMQGHIVADAVLIGTYQLKNK